MSEFNINEDAQSCGEFSGSQFSKGDASDSQPIESAFPDEDEETITMVDVLEREDKLEEEASAVLGNSDEKNCTYPKGYISRQALYSCATCSTGTDTPAAICLACSLECHDNHEVYELYTKRNYRCDCGNSKFKPDFECKLMDKQLKKSLLNENNKYNHNFSGKYCSCDKRYPPDENDNSPEANDEMWQCIVCEDWYHTKHLGVKELPTRFDEMMCGQCADKLEFVYYYREDEEPQTDSINNDDQVPEVADNNKREVIEQATKSDVKISNENGKVNAKSTSTTISTKSEDALESGTSCESDTNDSQAENKDPGQDLASSQAKVECTLEGLKSRIERSILTGPLFWSDHQWRSKLCRCLKCTEMYKSKDCEYLLDEKDTVQYYEAQGKAIAKNAQSPLERGMTALNRMNRAAVVEALHGYDELKADLSDYLRKFAESKKVVREEDIHEFFEKLKSKKRPRLDYS